MVPQDGLVEWLLSQDKCSHVLDISKVDSWPIHVVPQTRCF